MRLLLITLISLFPFGAMAQTWQELNQQAVDSFKQGDNKIASKLAIRAIDVYQQSPDYNTKFHAKVAINAARIIHAGGNFNKALKTLNKAASDIKKRLGKDDVATITLLTEIHDICLKDGQIKKAEQTYYKKIRLAKDIYGSGSLHTANMYVDMASRLKAYKKYKWVKSRLKNAHTIALQNLSEHDVRAMSYEYELAHVTAENKHYNEAESTLISILTRLRGQVETETYFDLTRKTHGELVNLYYHAGKNEDLEESWQNLLAVPRVNDQAQIIVQKAPKYTNKSKTGKKGYVDLEFTIAKDGFLKDINVTNNTAPGQFKTALLSAMKEWRFLPMTKNGVAVDQTGVKLKYAYASEKSTSLGSRINR